MDGFGNVYIADTGNYRVRKVDNAGIITTIAGTGVSDFFGDGGPATEAGLDSPFALVAVADGTVYVCDGYRVRRIDTAGIITTVAGIGRYGFSGDGGLATEAALYEPHGMTVDAQGNLYIADMENNRVRKVDTAGVITTIAEDSAPSGDGARPLSDPAGVAIGADGRLYIADMGSSRVLAHGAPPAAVGDRPYYGWAGVSGDGHLEVLAPTSGGDVEHWRQPVPGGGWELGPGRGTECLGAPLVALDAGRRVHGFLTRQNNWVRQVQEPDRWEWEDLAGQVSAAPVAVRNAQGCLELFVCGTRGSCGYTRQTSPNSDDWLHDRTGGSWVWLGDGLAVGGRPGVARDTNGRPIVIARFTDNIVQYVHQDPDGGWTGDWRALSDGALAGNPVATTSADGRLAVFGRGLDGLLPLLAGPGRNRRLVELDRVVQPRHHRGSGGRDGQRRPVVDRGPQPRRRSLPTRRDRPQPRLAQEMDAAGRDPGRNDPTRGRGQPHRATRDFRPLTAPCNTAPTPPAGKR
ncbi:hypothetical protein ACFWVM_04155 [Nocardia fluminea]|uniref:NHL domain-containing protein n=1 Tax=Nocardia fluminea TaxID=134984 RepID=UPI00365620F3